MCSQICPRSARICDYVERTHLILPPLTVDAHPASRSRLERHLGTDRERPDTACSIDRADLAGFGSLSGEVGSQLDDDTGRLVSEAHGAAARHKAELASVPDCRVSHSQQGEW